MILLPHSITLLYIFKYTFFHLTFNFFNLQSISSTLNTQRQKGSRRVSLLSQHLKRKASTFSPRSITVDEQEDLDHEHELADEARRLHHHQRDHHHHHERDSSKHHQRHDTHMKGKHSKAIE